MRESPQNAQRVLEGLLDSIFPLKLFPTRSKLQAPRASEAVHAMPMPPFVVYYRVRMPIECGLVVAAPVPYALLCVLSLGH